MNGILLRSSFTSVNSGAPNFLSSDLASKSGLWKRLPVGLGFAAVGAAKRMMIGHLLLSLMSILLLSGCDTASRKAVAHHDRAHKYQQMRQYDKALAEYQKALELQPDYPQVYIRIGNIYEDQREYVKAIEQYNKALQYRPKHIMALVNLGNVYRKMGNLAQAARAVELAVRYDPGEAWVIDNLGNIYQEMGQFDKAIEMYKKAVSFEPNDPEFHTDLANIYAKVGRNQEAIEHYRRVIELVEGLKNYKKERQYAETMIKRLSQ